MGQVWSEFFPPKNKFDSARDVPDLTGKVIIVTGGNTGIGRETVKILLAKNAKVYMASRTKSRADEAIAELKAETGREAIFLELNLANLASVTKAAAEFKSKESALHVLINSAGVMIPPIEQVTDDGYDLQFGTNVLGHAHFTLLLVPELAAGAKSSPDGKARVVNVSATAAHFAKIDWESLKGDSPTRKSLGTHKMYAQSKLGNIVFSNEFARRFVDQAIISNALQPGFLKTELQRYAGPLVKAITGFLFLQPAPMGALTQTWAATSTEAANYNGGWFIPWARAGKMEKEWVDPAQGQRLWEWIEEQRKDYV